MAGIVGDGDTHAGSDDRSHRDLRVQFRHILVNEIVGKPGETLVLFHGEDFSLPGR